LISDSKKNVELNRFGVKANTQYTAEQGTYYQFGNYSVWKIKIGSLNASSLNFVFSNLLLPQGAAMFIHSQGGRMIHGPVTLNNIKTDRYSTDVLLGDEAIIEVFLPENREEEFQIRIEHSIHGIKEENTKAFGDSQPCNVNTSCPIASAFQDEVDTVCLILVDNSNHCTGTLLNNECSDFTPFLLTADHCVDGYSDFSDWVFRFNYESVVCPSPGAEPAARIWISFTGAQLRAASSDTDFALLQLDDNLSGVDDIAFAGWDRTTTIPANAVYIHHPSGDVKKFTVDAGASIADPSPLPPISGAASGFSFNLSPGASGDVGTLEPGSSGCAQFNSANRVVGQQSGGSPQTILCTTSSSTNSNGRLSASWTGGGTNSTRLSNWLGASAAPMTTNTLVQPKIIGDDVICVSSKTYTLLNPVPGYTVTWSVTPSSLFGSSSTGTGVTAILYAASFNAQGAATLTYTLTSPTCGTQTYTKSLWMGKPSIGQINTPSCFTIGSNVHLNVPISGATEIEWTFPGCPNGTPVGDPDPECWFNYTGDGFKSIFVYVGEQSGYISVWASNECGSTSVNRAIVLCEGGPGGPGGPIIKMNSNKDNTAFAERVHLYPNPAKSDFTLLIHDSEEAKCNSYQVEIMNSQGIVVKREVINASRHLFSNKEFNPGLYLLKVKCGNDYAVRRIIIE
jgi:hypothetical protein